MPVVVKRYVEQDLTVISVKGEISSDEPLAALNEYYEGGVTGKAIWDFSEASGERGDYEQVERFMQFVKGRRPAQAPQGKTALVAPQNIDYGLARTASALSQIKELPVEVRVFKSLEEAADWLEVSYKGTEE
jgi:hypothetical protein